MPSSSERSLARGSETKQSVSRPVIPAATMCTSVTMGAPQTEGFEPAFEGCFVEDEALRVLGIRRGVDDALGDGARERPEVREVHQPAQDAVALGLYGVDAPQASSRSTSMQAATGQTSAHSAQPVQRSSRTMRGEG